MHAVIKHYVYVKKKFCFPKADASRGCGLSRIFPSVLLASGGVTMAVREAGGHSMGHLPPQEENGDRTSWKVSYFQMCWGNNQFCLAL